MTTYPGHQDSETGSEDIALNYWWQAQGLGKQNFTQASGRHKSGNPESLSASFYHFNGTFYDTLQTFTHWGWTVIKPSKHRQLSIEWSWFRSLLH